MDCGAHELTTPSRCPHQDGLASPAQTCSSALCLCLVVCACVCLFVCLFACLCENTLHTFPP